MIENFDDLSIEAVLYVAEKFITQTIDQKNSSLEEITFDNINVLEFTYDSSNPKHALKKKEVGLLLIGSIAEDIQVFKSNKQGSGAFNINNLFT